MQDREVAGYKCPFCEFKHELEDEIRKHIKSTKTGEHKGVNGFTTKHQPVTLYIEPEFPRKEQLMYGIAQELKTLDNDTINDIAEALDTSTTHVMRVYKDNDVDFTWKGRTGATTWDDLTELQTKVLHTYINDQRYEPRAIANTLGTDKRIAENAMESYKWLTSPKYFFSDEEVGKVDIDNFSRKEVLDFMEKHDLGEVETQDVKEKEDVDIQTGLEEDDSANNPFLIASVEQQFKIITALSKDGEDEMAEHLFRQAVGKEE